MLHQNIAAAVIFCSQWFVGLFKDPNVFDLRHAYVDFGWFSRWFAIYIHGFWGDIGKRFARPFTSAHKAILNVDWLAN